MTLPSGSRIGAAVLSMYSSLPSRRISSAGRTDLIGRLRRIATPTGFSIGSHVSSWKPRKISSMVRPTASSSRQPVSSDATGFRYCTRASASVVTTPSPIDCSVICALSFSRNSASSYSLRSVMSVSTPTSRFRRPLLVEPALHAALNPAPLAARVLHAMHALEQLGSALEMLAQLRLHVREIVGMHEQPPLGHVVVVRVAEHRAPTRREVHRVLAHVVVPQPVVRRIRHEAIALLDVGQVLRELDALESARAARAEQLQTRAADSADHSGFGAALKIAEHSAESAANV